MSNNNYIDKTEFTNELKSYKTTKVCSERLGELLILLHDKVMTHRNFNGYPQDVKDEMKSFSLFRIISKGLDSFDPNVGNAFSYFTAAVFSNYFRVLDRYYTRKNKERKLLIDTLKQAMSEGRITEQQGRELAMQICPEQNILGA